AWRVEARFAADSKEAFQAIRDGFEPGVVFCDQRLRSGESGFDILRALLDRLPGARGAMVSGEFASAELAQAEDEGYLVIRKPVNIEQLHSVLTRWLVEETVSG
ncbi:MAG: response regulator, partial [Comamonadaceae bacterium]